MNLKSEYGALIPEQPLFTSYTTLTAQCNSKKHFPAYVMLHILYTCNVRYFCQEWIFYEINQPLAGYNTLLLHRTQNNARLKKCTCSSFLDCSSH